MKGLKNKICSQILNITEMKPNLLKWQFLGQGRKASKLGGAYDFLFFLFLCPHFGSCNFLHCCICIESGKMA